MGDLVKHGQIEAIDANDLLSQFAANLETIAEKNKEKEKKIWVEGKKREILNAYTFKAKKALQAQWDLCGSKGHNFRNLDIQGVTALVCADCSYCGRNDEYVGHNEASINSLTKRLMALDTEAGILNWPTVEDYKPAVAAKVNGRFTQMILRKAKVS
jgi:hypothetical protein